MQTKNILLVEDDVRDIELTMTALSEQNLANQIVIQRDGVDALAYLRREGEFSERAAIDPILIMLDVKMPRMNGIELLAEIKQDPKLKTIPVVMLTSSNQDQDILASYELGANAYVVKPVIFEAFMEAVKQIGLFWLLTNQPPTDS